LGTAAIIKAQVVKDAKVTSLQTSWQVTGMDIPRVVPEAYFDFSNTYKYV
jgi:hypothetical protein